MIPLWAKALMFTVLVGMIAYAGWQINQWRTDAADAKQLRIDIAQAEADRAAEVAARDEAEARVGRKEAELLDMQEREHTADLKRKEEVSRVVPDNRDCDFGLEFNRLLNDARGYDPLPGASGRVEVTSR